MEEIQLPSPCLVCPNAAALRLAIINFELELSKENLLRIIDNLESHCSGKCAIDAEAAEATKKTVV